MIREWKGGKHGSGDFTGGKSRQVGAAVMTSQPVETNHRKPVTTPQATL